MGEDLPTNDMLNIAVHLPFVEIREMIEDSQEVSKTFKNESVNASKQLQNILLERVKNDKKFSKLFSKYFRFCFISKFFKILWVFDQKSAKF